MAALAIAALVIVVIAKSAVVVPQQNAFVVEHLGKYSRTLRAGFHILNIRPPNDVLAAMEKQMRAEREKRAVVLTSEGERDAQISQAEGEKQKVIKESEADKQKQIHEAEGQAAAILAVATATAEGLRSVAAAPSTEGGAEAMQLRVAEQYVAQFGEIAKEGNTLVVPANLSDVSSMIALATKVAKGTAAAGPTNGRIG